VRLRGSREHDTISGTHEFAVLDPVTDAKVDSGTGSLSGSPVDA
jgi:hypothetical protein